jgi:hypothetical protein
MSSAPRGHRFRTYRGADVVFRLGAAVGAVWVYLRTLFVVAPGTDPVAWHIFAWTGWPFVLAVGIGAIATLVAWIREQ